jgi:hypothetical protein
MKIGGMYLQRIDLELPNEEKSILTRKIILNQEIEFSEYLYDIKIFELYKTETLEVISY